MIKFTKNWELCFWIILGIKHAICQIYANFLIQVTIHKKLRDALFVTLDLLKKVIILLFTVFFLKLYREMEFVACSPFLFRSPLLYVICPNRLHLPALPTPSAREQPNTSEQYSPPRAHLLISPLSFITCQDVPLAAFTSDNSPQLTRTSSGLHFSSQLSHLSGERFSFSKSRKGLVLMLLFFFY